MDQRRYRFGNHENSTMRGFSGTSEETTALLLRAKDIRQGNKSNKGFNWRKRPGTAIASGIRTPPAYAAKFSRQELQRREAVAATQAKLETRLAGAPSWPATPCVCAMPVPRGNNALMLYAAGVASVVPVPVLLVVDDAGASIASASLPLALPLPLTRTLPASIQVVYSTPDSAGARCVEEVPLQHGSAVVTACDAAAAADVNTAPSHPFTVPSLPAENAVAVEEVCSS